MFSALSEREINISVKSILLSANAFNLDQSKILPFSKGLIGSYVHSEISITFTSLPNYKSLDLSKFKVFADDKKNVTETEKQKFVIERVENMLEKKRKCWLPACSVFVNL